MKMLRSASVLALLASALAASAQVYTVSHTFAASDPQMNPRFRPDYNPSQYPYNVKSAPGILSESAHYGTFTIPASNAPRVVTAVCTSTGTA